MKENFDFQENIDSESDDQFKPVMDDSISGQLLGQDPQSINSEEDPDPDELDKMEEAERSPMDEDSLRTFLREIREESLLSREEEIELAKAISAGQTAEAQLKDDSLMLSDETRTEMEELIENGQKAKERFTRANLRLVVFIAKKYVGRGLQLQDLIQEGTIALSKAVERYDCSRGNKFSTYATKCIQGEISHALGDQARSIRIPRGNVDAINKMKGISHDLLLELGHDPSLEEIAERMDLKPEKVKELNEMERLDDKYFHSLDEPIQGGEGEDERLILGDLIKDESSDPKKIDAIISLDEEMGRILSTMLPMDYEIYYRVHYLLQTYEEVGKALGISVELTQNYDDRAILEVEENLSGNLIDNAREAGLLERDNEF